MSNVEKLIEELKNHPEAEALLKEQDRTDTMAEYAEALLSVAGRLGIETKVDPTELADYLEKMEASRRASTNKTVEDVAALDDDDMKAVAGGEIKMPVPKKMKKCGKKHDAFLSCAINDKCVITWNDWEK